MSLRLTAAQAAYIAAAVNGGGAFTMIAGVRPESLPGAKQVLFARNDDSFFQSDHAEIDGADEYTASHQFTTSGSAGTAVASTWVGLMLAYTGETTPGVSADGVLELYRVADGDLSAVTEFDDTTLAGPVTGLSDLAASQIILGAMNQALDDPANITVSHFKVFAVVLTEAQGITELRFKNPQLTAWGAYPFPSGAGLLNDVSGGDRHLVGIGSPTYIADEPTFLEGDDPAGGGTPVSQTAGGSSEHLAAVEQEEAGSTERRTPVAAEVPPPAEHVVPAAAEFQAPTEHLAAPNTADRSVTAPTEWLEPIEAGRSHPTEHLVPIQATASPSAEHLEVVDTTLTALSEHLVGSAFTWQLATENRAAISSELDASGEHRAPVEAAIQALTEHLSSAAVSKAVAAPAEHRATIQGELQGSVERLARALREAAGSSERLAFVDVDLVVLSEHLPAPGVVTATAMGSTEHLGAILAEVPTETEHRTLLERAASASAERLTRAAAASAGPVESLAPVEQSFVILSERLAVVVQTVTLPTEHDTTLARLALILDLTAASPLNLTITAAPEAS